MSIFVEIDMGAIPVAKQSARRQRASTLSAMTGRRGWGEDSAFA